MRMQAQLQEIAADFEAASTRLDRLEQQLGPEEWVRRPAAGGWSPAECVAHLNLTSERFLPLMHAALAEAPPLPGGSDRRLRRDLTGWLLWKVMPPPVRLVRSRTTAPFSPGAELDPAAVVREFRHWQPALLAVVDGSRGRAIDRVSIQSPFDGRARYNLFACLGILARHQHRHLWQAERQG